MGNTIYNAYRTQTFTPETKISKISTSFTVRNTYWFFLSLFLVCFILNACHNPLIDFTTYSGKNPMQKLYGLE